MEAARTPDERFVNLKEYPFQPCYVEVPSGASSGATTLRMHYIDEGPRDAPETILCMHGQPSWSYLYRKMVPFFVAAGHRVLCPDLVGFGRSDKPTKRSDYTYAAHTQWMNDWLLALDLRNVTLVCQDWGGLIGLRVVAANESRFARIVVANTGLPTGMVPSVLTGPVRRGYEQMPVPDVDEVNAAIGEGRSPGLGTMIKMVIFRQPPPPEKMFGFLFFMKWCSDAPEMTPREVFKQLGNYDDDVLDGYGAPFPEEKKEQYIAGARQFASLVPLFWDGGFRGEVRDVEDNKAAWRVLERWDKPFLCAFSDNDPTFRGVDKEFQQRVPGAWKTEHVTIKGAGHFLQEDKPQELAEAVLDFLAGKRRNPNGSKPRKWLGAR